MTKINNIEELSALSKEELKQYIENNKTSYIHYGLPVIEIEDEEWAIAMDEAEADAAAYEYIAEMVWAFTPNFMSGMTGIHIVVFETCYKSNLCESLNDAYRALIEGTCGFEEFADTAICEDGRGHFLSPWDSEEVELECGAYAYRIN